MPAVELSHFLTKDCIYSLTFFYLRLHILWISVESSVFIGDQCSLISWVTLTHEIMSPQMFNKVMDGTVRQQTSY